MWHLYIMPLVADFMGRGPEWRGVKHWKPMPRRACVDFGKLDWCIAAGDVADEDHVEILTDIDVLAFPPGLDDLVDAAWLSELGTLLGVLAGLDTLSTAITYRETARRLIGIAQVYHRYHTIANTAVPMVEADTPLKNLTAQQGVPIVDALTTVTRPGSNGTRAVIDLTQTLRSAVNSFSDAWANHPERIGDMVI